MVLGCRPVGLYIGSLHLQYLRWSDDQNGGLVPTTEKVLLQPATVFRLFFLIVEAGSPETKSQRRQAGLQLFRAASWPLVAQKDRQYGGLSETIQTASWPMATRGLIQKDRQNGGLS